MSLFLQKGDVQIGVQDTQGGGDLEKVCSLLIVFPIPLPYVPHVISTFDMRVRLPLLRLGETRFAFDLQPHTFLFLFFPLLVHLIVAPGYWPILLTVSSFHLFSSSRQEREDKNIGAKGIIPLRCTIVCVIIMNEESRHHCKGMSQVMIARYRLHVRANLPEERARFDVRDTTLVAFFHSTHLLFQICERRLARFLTECC